MPFSFCVTTWTHMSKLNSSAFPITVSVFSELYSWIHFNYFTAWLPLNFLQPHVSNLNWCCFTYSSVSSSDGLIKLHATSVIILVVVTFEILNSKFMFRRVEFRPISEVQVVNCIQFIYKIIVVTFSYIRRNTTNTFLAFLVHFLRFAAMYPVSAFLAHFLKFAAMYPVSIKGEQL
jgi:hypothetical protein